jgi:hypothetical protein
MRNAEIANLRTISPNPGQPFANVENKRCRVSPLRDYAIRAGGGNLIRVAGFALSSETTD